MKQRLLFTVTCALLAVVVVLATAGYAISAAPSAATAKSNVVINVAPAGQSTTTFTYNFNPFSSKCLFPTIAGIYEPLMINNRLAGKNVPWLATKYTWSKNLMGLTFTLRSGVKWSDGTPFTSADVVYTFNLLKSNTALTGTAAVAVQGTNAYIASVTAPNAKTVVFHFNKVYTPGFYDIIGQDIVPEHVWKDVSNPATNANLKPVGTGPFTQVTTMETQVYEVDRNPYYWQAGQPYVKGLRMPAYADNNAVATMLVNGDVDWTGQFIANFKQAVMANNKHAHYWWPSTACQFMQVNAAVAPFNDPIVRKAISMCLNRKQLGQIANQGTATLADVTGLAPGGYAAWKVANPASLGPWCTYNLAKANKMLDAAGYTKGANGVRTTKDGKPWTCELSLVNGFSDWAAMAPTLQSELDALGFAITVKNYDMGAWTGKLIMGNFQMSLFFGVEADNPYIYYRNMMSSQTCKPVGTATAFGQNFWRVAVPAAEAPLTKFASTDKLKLQKQAAVALQKIFADNMPVIPLYNAGCYYCYSDAKCAGWANKTNPLGRPMPATGQHTNEQLLLMVSWKKK